MRYLLYLFCFFSFIASGAAYACKEQGNHIALITGIVNGVNVERKGEQCEGKIRMRLYEGDILVTGQKQKCILLFSDNSEIKLNENTRLVLEQAASSKTRKKKTILNMLFGEIFANISKNKNRQVEIKAGRAVAAIEGTMLNYRWPKDTQTAQLTVAEGLVRYFGIQAPLVYQNVRPYWVYVKKNYRCDYNQNSSPKWVPTVMVPVQNMSEIVGWNEEIRQYIVTINEAISTCQLLLLATQNNQGAMPQGATEKLNDLIYEFDKIKHDSDFDRGHKALYTAFNNFKLCAAGLPEFCHTAQSYYNQGISEFQIYQQKFKTSEDLLRKQY